MARTPRGKPHPRSYGTFPRVLGRYAREQRVLTLAEAVHKMTGLPRAPPGAARPRRDPPGARADLVVLDPRKVADQATFEDPHRYRHRHRARDGQRTRS